MNVLFVCTGNTCRSPMAEAVLRSKLPQVNVQSAGIFAHDNDPANTNALKALQEKGIELVHSAQSVTTQNLAWADIVLTMTDAHRQLLVEYFPAYKNKTYTLIEYVKDTDPYENRLSLDKDIADPFGGSLAMYKKTLLEIEQYIDDLIEKIGG